MREFIKEIRPFLEKFFLKKTKWYDSCQNNIKTFYNGIIEI